VPPLFRADTQVRPYKQTTVGLQPGIRLTDYQASSLHADPRPAQGTARLQSDKGGKILHFYFLLRHCLADTLQVVKILD
jgi:hypothetical protein